nr:restriction endonuclease subunit S [Lactococcus lactis]AEK97240.1 type I R/M system HsdS subunit [Lactococcus lactis subsp. lactis bv. diacetylactis]
MVGTMAKIDDSVKKKIPELRFEGFTDAWEQRKLGEVATLSSSKRIHLSDYVTEGIPFYRGSEISTGGITGNQELFISQEKFDEIKEKYGVPSEGDILVTAVGTLGNLWKVDSRRFYYKDGNLIQISKIQVNSDYLLTYFTGGIGKKRLLDSAAGSNQKALTMVKMREITVDFPSEDEQKKIGAFFKQLDDTITLHQRKLDLLKEQKKGYLQKMFPKNGAKVPELRFAGFADDWEERKLSSGLREYTDRVIVEDDKEYYQISVRNNFGGITLRGSKMGNKIGRKRQAKINLTKYPQTLIFTRQTVEQGGIGWVDKYCDGAIVTENMPTISLDTSVFSKYFLTNLFQTRIFYKNAILDNIEGGSAQIAIHESKFLSSTLLFPNLDEQEKIGQFFKQLDDTIDLHQRKLDLLKEQKKGFLQKMFV